MMDQETQAIYAARYEYIRKNGCPLAETDPAWGDPEAFDAEIDAMISWAASK